LSGVISFNAFENQRYALCHLRLSVPNWKYRQPTCSFGFADRLFQDTLAGLAKADLLGPAGAEIFTYKRF